MHDRTENESPQSPRVFATAYVAPPEVSARMSSRRGAELPAAQRPRPLDQGVVILRGGQASRRPARSYCLQVGKSAARMRAFAPGGVWPDGVYTVGGGRLMAGAPRAARVRCGGLNGGRDGSGGDRRAAARAAPPGTVPGHVRKRQARAQMGTVPRQVGKGQARLQAGTVPGQVPERQNAPSGDSPPTGPQRTGAPPCGDSPRSCPERTGAARRGPSLEQGRKGQVESPTAARRRRG